MWNHARRPNRVFHILQRSPTGALLLLALILVASLLIIFGNGGNQDAGSEYRKPKLNRYISLVQFQHIVEHINGSEIIWQIPDVPKAVLFIAHGCNCHAANFWDRYPGCPNCVGLPEDRLIVLNALYLKFAVITISSSGKCWSYGKEVQVVKQIIGSWIEKHKLQKLPMMALGASSGGHFVSVLAKKMRFNSIVLMISEGVFDAMSIPEGYPPTLFLHMPKDVRRMRLIKMNMEALRKKGVQVKEVKCMEIPLTPTLLSDRIPGLDQKSSVKIYDLLKENGSIDQNGYLKKDGRKSQWKVAIRNYESLLQKYDLFDHIQEELNLAYGYHEMTSLQTDEISSWFDSHLS